MNRSQQAVFNTIRRAKTSTRQSVAAAMNKPINSVTARVRELLDKGLIEECGYSHIAERPRAILRVVKR